MAAISRQALAELSLKYLYFMVFIKSASIETLRSYRLDLLQAFELPKDALPSGRENFSNPAPRPPASLDSEAEDGLLRVCRAAVSRWSTLAPASRNRKAATLKSFLGWLHQQSLISRDLAAQIHAPKVPIRLPHHLSVDEVQALLTHLKNELQQGRPAQEALILILILYGGGLRISEACGLEWSQVSNEGRVLRVRGKGAKERMVTLPPMAAAWLWRSPSRGLFRYVFGDGPLSTRKAYEIVRQAGSRAGLIKPLHPHALRHSYATHLLASGANLRTLQELLGHQSLQATERYTHLSIDQLARTLEECHPLSTRAAKIRKLRNS